MRRRRVLAAAGAGLALAVVAVGTTVSPTVAAGPEPVREQLSCTTDAQGFCTLPINAAHVQVTAKTRANPWFLNVADLAPLTLRATHHDGTPRANVKIYFQATYVVAADPAPPTTTTTTTTTTAVPPPDPGGGEPLGLPTIPWEGGPAYYRQLGIDAWDDPKFFPIGVWYESVTSQADIDKDKAVGVNTYVELTGNSNMSLIRSNGQYAIPFGQLSGYGAETVAWLLDDEVDMRWGPGSGYDRNAQRIAELPKDGRPKYSNYGKGVMFWETDDEASTFVNQFQQLVSNDIYWYTDPNVCRDSEGPTRVVGTGPVSPYSGKRNLTTAECRRAWNYGVTMDRMRKLDRLDGKRQAVYNFVEVGHPFTENDAPTITGPQIKGAVMSSLIHEARGILYFNHSFGGACQSQHLLRDSCGAANRPSVVAVNQQIADLAPVLNTQSLKYDFGTGLDTMLKHAGGSYYVFAMTDKGGTGERTFTLPPGLTATSVQVLYENRTLPVSGGKFTDSFAAEYSYHVYKITP